MIGSVHGCVSCPVVVGPWEPQESLSHPQHPLPSHPQPQSQTYSFSQRSSSVHPLPQKITPDDEKDGNTPSSQGGAHAQTPGQSQHLTETKTEPSKPRSPKKTGSRNGSPKKAGSANGSPQKTRPTTKSPKSILSIFRSRQATSEQCEQLLGPKNIDNINVSTSSQKAVGFQSTSPDDSASIEHGQGVHQVGTSQTNFTLPGAVDNGRQYPTNFAGNKCSQSSDVKEDFPKESAPRSSLPAVEQMLDSSGTGSAPVHKTGLSSAPLPSIQDRSKMLTAGALSRELSQVSLVGSLRPSKKLPSISNPKLEPLKATSLPPRPSLSTRKERKRQTQAPQKKKTGISDASSGDSLQKMKHGGKGEPDPQNSMSALFDKVPEVSPPKTLASGKSDIAVQQCGSSTELKFEKKADTSSQALAQAASSPVRSCQDAPTPQSLESSVWSFGLSAVASEIDALTTAAAAGDLKTVGSLLAAGVSVNAVNTFGRTAVQVMSVTNTDVAEVLLKAGADPNVQDKGRRAATSTFRTIAHDVADSGNTDMLRCLLCHGADVSLQDKWGNTPLHLAAKGGHLAAVRLLRRGTSLYLPNLQDKTPMMLLGETDDSAIKEWVKMKKSTVSRLQTLCVLAIRQKLGPDGLRQWRMHAPNSKVQLQVLLQSKGVGPPLQASTSTILSSQHSTGSRSLTARVRGSGNGHPLLPGMSTGKQMTDFLTLRDLIPRRLSTGENTSLEVHNTSGGQSIDDVSLGAGPGPGAQATSSLASESGSLFETNLSSIEASHSTDDVSLPSFDQSL